MNVSALVWDQIAGNFDNQEQQVESIRNRVVEQTRKYLGGNEVLLDFGCGTGTLAVALAESVKAVQGIDISSKMTAVVKQYTACWALRDCALGRSTQMTFENQQEANHAGHRQPPDICS